jgi:hypothetical protein
MRKQDQKTFGHCPFINNESKIISSSKAFSKDEEPMLVKCEIPK